MNIARLVISVALALAPAAAFADAPSPDTLPCQGRNPGDACILESGGAGRCQAFTYRRVTSGTMATEVRCIPAPTNRTSPRH